jgi:hypothetical protein
VVLRTIKLGETYNFFVMKPNIYENLKMLCDGSPEAAMSKLKSPRRCVAQKIADKSSLQQVVESTVAY